MIPLLVLRPEPGASATAVRARALGLVAVTAPLFGTQSLEWEAPPAAAFDALLFTSAQAPRLAGPQLAYYNHLPVFTVGEATAEAARAAGFVKVETGAGDAAEMLARAVAAGAERVLHLCGADHRDAAHPALRLTRRLVYEAVAAATLPAALVATLAAGPAVAAIHSPRAGRLFARLLEEAALARSRVSLAAISAAALDAAGQGWRAAAAACVPTDPALLAEAARLCESSA